MHAVKNEAFTKISDRLSRLIDANFPISTTRNRASCDPDKVLQRMLAHRVAGVIQQKIRTTPRKNTLKCLRQAVIWPGQCAVTVSQIMRELGLDPARMGRKQVDTERKRVERIIRKIAKAGYWRVDSRGATLITLIPPSETPEGASGPPDYGDVPVDDFEPAWGDPDASCPSTPRKLSMVEEEKEAEVTEACAAEDSEVVQATPSKASLITDVSTQTTESVLPPPTHAHTRVKDVEGEAKALIEHFDLTMKRTTVGHTKTRFIDNYREKSASGAVTFESIRQAIDQLAEHPLTAATTNFIGRLWHAACGYEEARLWDEALLHDMVPYRRERWAPEEIAAALSTWQAGALRKGEGRPPLLPPDVMHRHTLKLLGVRNDEAYPASVDSGGEALVESGGFDMSKFNLAAFLEETARARAKADSIQLA